MDALESAEEWQRGGLEANEADAFSTLRRSEEASRVRLDDVAGSMGRMAVDETLQRDVLEDDEAAAFSELIRTQDYHARALSTTEDGLRQLDKDEKTGREGVESEWTAGLPEMEAAMNYGAAQLGTVREGLWEVPHEEAQLREDIDRDYFDGLSTLHDVEHGTRRRLEDVAGGLEQLPIDEAFQRQDIEDDEAAAVVQLQRLHAHHADALRAAASSLASLQADEAAGRSDIEEDWAEGVGDIEALRAFAETQLESARRAIDALLEVEEGQRGGMQGEEAAEFDGLCEARETDLLRLGYNAIMRADRDGEELQKVINGAQVAEGDARRAITTEADAARADLLRVLLSGAHDAHRTELVDNAAILQLARDEAGGRGAVVEEEGTSRDALVAQRLKDIRRMQETAAREVDATHQSLAWKTEDAQELSTQLATTQHELDTTKKAAALALDEQAARGALVDEETATAEEVFGQRLNALRKCIVKHGRHVDSLAAELATTQEEAADLSQRLQATQVSADVALAEQEARLEIVTEEWSARNDLWRFLVRGWVRRYQLLRAQEREKDARRLMQAEDDVDSEPRARDAIAKDETVESEALRQLQRALKELAAQKALERAAGDAAARRAVEDAEGGSRKGIAEEQALARGEMAAAAGCHRAGIRQAEALLEDEAVMRREMGHLEDSTRARLREAMADDRHSALNALAAKQSAQDRLRDAEQASRKDIAHVEALAATQLRSAIRSEGHDAKKRADKRVRFRFEADEDGGREDIDRAERQQRRRLYDARAGPLPGLLGDDEREHRGSLKAAEDHGRRQLVGMERAARAAAQARDAAMKKRFNNLLRDEGVERSDLEDLFTAELDELYADREAGAERLQRRLDEEERLRKESALYHDLLAHKRYTSYMGLDVSEGIIVGRSEVHPGERLSRFGEVIDIEGVKVFQVNVDGPSARAGVRTDDIITHYNGARTPSLLHFKACAKKTTPGDEVMLTLYRPGEGCINAKVQSLVVDESSFEQGSRRIYSYKIPVLK
eukprot:TRINITY_DN6794_c0_g1_i3.p1 TRINITY_DN6794_c0_g1~~TRINITY_DN6794_c0_g1_i3.p1  ORF type:complete len:1040 (+),score=364.85 TRINITY_DN6794_c0_g1_i3:65-3121(+)